MMEVKAPSLDEIRRFREELHSLRANDPSNYPDNETIEKIVHLPPSLFYEAVRDLMLVFGPLASFPAREYPFLTTTPNGKPKSKRLNPIVDDGASLLDDSLAALTGYNEFLEEKVAKLRIQSDRSLAALRESSASDHDTTRLDETITATKLRRSALEKEIAALRESLDSRARERSHMFDELDTSLNDALSLNFSDMGDRSGPETGLRGALWDEHDSALQHIQRWRHLVTVDSDGGEAIIEQARQHVNQLVYSITRRCQVQLATVFHRSLVDDAAEPDQQVVQDEAADIIKEIDWLWEEVIPVAHMSVSAQFLRPVLTQFDNWKESKTFREAIVTTYASGVLKFMNDRLSAVAERTRTLVYHHQALDQIDGVRRSTEPTGPVDTTTDRTPHTPPRKLQPRREQSAAAENLRAFMQIYGAVPLHADGPTPKPTPSLLDEYVQARAHKGDTLLRDLHKVFESITKSTLADKEQSEEALQESLLADSAANPAQSGSVYKDAELEGSIAVLQAQTNQIRQMFKDLKFEGPESAPDYVDYAARQIANQRAANVSGKPSRGAESSDPASADGIRCAKFNEFVRKWGGC